MHPEPAGAGSGDAMNAIQIQTATGRRTVARDYLTAAQSAWCLMTDDERRRFSAWLASLDRKVTP